MRINKIIINTDDKVILVLITSNGVVKPAAIPPDKDPHIADWSGSHFLSLLYFMTNVFKYSHNGYWIVPNGISLKTVDK